MITLLPHRPLLATAIIAALLGGSLTAGAASVEADETTTVGLAEVTLPALVADSAGVGMIAAQGEMPLDPRVTVFAADRNHETVSTLEVDASAAPDSITIADASLSYEVTSAPDGGSVAVQVINAEGTRVDWLAGEPRNLVGSGTAQLGWTFDSTGQYVVTVTAAVVVGEATAPGDEHPTNEDSTTFVGPDITGDEPSTGPESVTVTTNYTFEIAEPAAPSEEPPAATTRPGSSDEQSPTESAKPRSSAAVADAAVVSEGDIRVMTTVDDGRLVQGLADFSNDSDGVPLDLATTVLVVPHAETWPGANADEDAELWSLIAPDQGQVWRTSTDGLTANPLTLSVDSRGIEPDTLYSYFGSIGIPEGGLFTRLGQITGPASAALLGDGRSNAGTSLRAGDDAPWSETGPLGDAGVVPSQWPFVAAFTESGRYCVTLQSNSQLSGTGTVLNNDVTLTFAVGDTDPATVEPCEQPASIASQAPTPIPSGAEEVTVIDSGVALLGSILNDSALSLDVVTTERGLTTSYDPSQVVFSLPNRDTRWPGAGALTNVQENWARYLAEDARAYRSAGRYLVPGQNPSDERANSLTLDLDARFINANDIPDVGVNYDFEGVSTTSDTGYMFTYRTDTEAGVSSAENIGFWNSRPGGDHIPQQADTAVEWGDPFYIPNKERNGTTALGMAFSSAGVYCVTLKTSATLADGTATEDRATFTFAVGIDAHAVTPCSQESGEPGGGGEGPGEEPEELDPTVTWMQQGHVDLALRDNGEGSLGFATGDPATVGMHRLKDAVWVGRGSYSTYTVREPTSFDDRTFIGPVGTTYYGFSATAENVSRTLWPGLSMLYLPVGVTSRNAAWTLQKVSGPGDVFSWTGGATYLNSREQEPTAFDLGHTHVHQNWAFTEAGVYCLAVSARLRTADDESHDKTASELLTVAVGDVDLSTVQPCARTQEVPPPPAPASITLSTEPTVIGSGDFSRELQLTSVNGAPDVVVSVTERLGDAPVYVDPEQVVYSPRQVADRYQFATRWRTLLNGLGGDVALTLGNVAGPGNYYMTGNRVDDQAVQLDTRDGQEQSREALWPGYGFPSVHRFSAAGIYCVPFTWSGTTEAGDSFEVTKTLTFAAGVDPSGVKPCADGGEGTDPGEEPDPDPVKWDVPNHTTTDSGATIITTGHIDIASQLTGDRLTTTIKDGSDATKPAAHRSPAETVLQARPDAEITVPADAAYSFLGEAGTSAWLLPAAEQSGLLWPGWSTEELPQNATATGVNWTLTDVSGPGEFALYQTPFSGPQVLFNTRDGITREDSLDIPKNTHAHASWAFSAEGTYCLAFTKSTTLTSGKKSSDSFTLAFAVGVVDVTKVDPTKCFTEPEGQPSESDTTPIPLSSLTENNAGGVQVLDAASGLTAGQLVTAQVDRARAGKWVSVWLDDTSWLGWVQVGASGAIQVRLPSAALPGSHAFVAKDRDGGLIGWDSLSIVTAENPGDGGEDPDGPGGEEPEPDAVWDVPNATVNETGATVLNNGHVDVASLVEGRSLPTQVKDTTQSSTPTWRDPAKTLFQLLPSSRATVPAGTQWSFLGATGASFYQVTQRQQTGLLWPGWSTESIPTDATKGGVDWTLTATSGPGEFTLYETGPFGAPTIFFTTRDGITGADKITIPKNTHAHGSWAFSAQGNYCLAFERSATLASGEKVSDKFVLAFAIGRADVMKVDPAACFTVPDDQPTDRDSTPVADGELTDAASGQVRVLDKAEGFAPGQLVTVQVGAEHREEWVSVWLHSDPVWLGWAKTDADGITRVRLPDNAALGSYKVVVKERDGALIGWDSLTVIDAQNSGGGDGENPGEEEPIPDAVWDVPNGTVNNTGATVLNNGHVDIASLLDGGGLDSKVKDTSESSDPVWRDLDRTVLQLLPGARTAVPAGSAYRFLGEAGSPFYQVTQTQQPGLLWPGWSTEAIPLSATTGGVTWSLTDVSGPGEFALYESDSFGQPQILFNTRDGITDADRTTIPKNTHAHGSWAFSSQGNYCLSMQRTAQLSSGQTVSSQFVLAVAVGTADVMEIDPANCGKLVDTSPVDVPPSVDGGSTAPAAQQVAATQCVAGATVLSSGHVDYASRIVGGQLESLIGDDTSGTKVYREPGGTILWLKPSSRVTLPAGYGQVGPAGAGVWQVPQTQNLDLIWLGWNTESLNAGNTRGPVQWTINSIDGPGSMKVYLSGAFGGVQQLVFDSGGSYSIPLGVHAHANWAFSAEGVYRISTTQTATLANGQTSSDTETLTIVVGNVDPSSAAGSGSGCGTVSNALLVSDDADGTLLSAEQAAADAAAAAREVLPGKVTPDSDITDPFTALAQGNPVPLLLSILGALLLVGAVGTGVLWWRRRWSIDPVRATA